MSTQCSTADVLTALFALVDDTCLFLYGNRTLPRERGPEPTLAASDCGGALHCRPTARFPTPTPSPVSIPPTLAAVLPNTDAQL
jgi:hypothetical protein